ncbi:MAG: amidohydrolase family protein [bacterium]
MIIDIYTHIFPAGYRLRWEKAAPDLRDIGKRMTSVTEVHDLDARFRAMDRVDDYRQIVSLPGPPLEAITTPEVGTQLAAVANDTMAELVGRHPQRFAGFAAALALHNLDGAMVELHRAMGELGAKGIQLFTNVGGSPLDGERFEPVFAAMAEYDLPIWLHPARPAAVKDYQAEERSRYEMWWALGWPYDTSVAMARLALGGLFDRHPRLKIVTHHCGGMIPFFEGRLDTGLNNLGARTSGEDYSTVLSSLKKPHGEYFRMFYADTAMFGSHIGTRCGLEYFGVEHIVFASDCPFATIPEAVEAIGKLGLDGGGMERVFRGNAEGLMNTTFA